MFKKEYLWAVLIAFCVLVFSNLYLLAGIFEPKPELVFLGRRVINSQDMYTYVSFIEQARQGKILFENLYTTEPQTATLLRPSYILLGGTAAVIGTSSVFMYHLGRIFFSIIFFFVLYVFITQFFKTPKRRLLAFSVALTAGGIGFAVVGLFPQATDLWIPESITFLSLQEAPHFILSQTLMLLAFIFLLKGWSAGRDRSALARTVAGLNSPASVIKYFILSLLSLILLGFEHPYNLLIYVVTVVFAAGYLVIRHLENTPTFKSGMNRGKKTAFLRDENPGFESGEAVIKGRIPKKILLAGVLTTVFGFLIGFLYQYSETLRNPTLRSWVSTSDSPTPINFLVGFGLLLIFACVGLEVFLTKRRLPQILIVSWVAASSILMYSPVFFQRRLSEGLHIPLSILAAEGIIIISIFISSFTVKKVQNIAKYGFAILVVLAMMVGTLLGVKSDTSTIGGDNAGAYYYYILRSELHAARFIRDNTTNQDVILSNWFYGNILPGISGRKVYIGHKAQTKDFDKKVEKINKFILNKNTNAAHAFLKKNGITYIYLGSNDTMLRYGFKPDAKPYLTKVFDEGGARVYKVK